MAVRLNAIVKGKPLPVKAPIGDGFVSLTLTALDFGADPTPGVNYDALAAAEPVWPAGMAGRVGPWFLVWWGWAGESGFLSQVTQIH